MAKRLRPIGHDDRLSVVDHLDELRNRLIVCAVTLVVAFAACFTFSGHLLSVLNHPVDKSTASSLTGLTGDSTAQRHYALGLSEDLQLLARSPTQSVHDRALLAAAAGNAKHFAQSLPKPTNGYTPLTIGVGEPFMTTLTVCFWFAVLISLPVLLYQAFAFVVPALEPREKRVLKPVAIAAPGLFLAGVVFTYLVVLPKAIKFLQGYNASHFHSVIQAQQLYSFEVMTMAAIGLAFEMPLLLLGLQAVGVINGTTLTRHWRYAVVILAVVAAAMPGADPVTTGLEVAPLAVLFLASIVLLKLVDRRAARREAAAAAQELGQVGGLTGP